VRVKKEQKSGENRKGILKEGLKKKEDVWKWKESGGERKMRDKGK